jgi:hypothetical protein
MEGTTYDVRIYKTDVYRGAKVTTYYVRWKVDDKRWKEHFRSAAQADSFRSELLAAARRGEAFSAETGRPTSWLRPASDEPGLSWHEFARIYVPPNGLTSPPTTGAA